MDYSRFNRKEWKTFLSLQNHAKLGKSQNAPFSGLVDRTLFKDIEMEKALIYSFLALTVSPTEAWQKNSSMGDRSDMVGKTTADEEVCSKVKNDSNEKEGNLTGQKLIK